MSWFKKKYSVCAECRVHFEPATGMDADRWPDLCPTHRKPVKERDLRKSSVMSWALQNWEKLEPQYLKECKKQDKWLAKFSAKMKNETQPLLYSGLGGVFTAQAAYQQMKPWE